MEIATHDLCSPSRRGSSIALTTHYPITQRIGWSGHHNYVPIRRRLVVDSGDEATCRANEGRCSRWSPLNKANRAAENATGDRNRCLTHNSTLNTKLRLGELATFVSKCCGCGFLEPRELIKVGAFTNFQVGEQKPACAAPTRLTAATRHRFVATGSVSNLDDCRRP